MTNNYIVSLGDWESAFEKAQTFVNSLTNEEKISFIGGGSAGNFSALEFKDSSSSILDYYYVTTWPAPLSMAMTWDKDLVHQQALALGSEMKAKGINIANAPTTQPLGRCADGGRNGETYGPDSYLNGLMTGQAAKGLSDGGVVPGGKHWLLNEQETNREGMGSSEAYSSVIDDKTLHETYLSPFMDAIKNGLGAMMCAMPMVNGTYSCENQDLVAGYLKSELGFPGLVYPDVSGQKTGINSANAGLDYGSSQYWSSETMLAAINNGSLTTARLNDMVIRNIIGYYKLGQDSSSFPSLSEAGDYVDPRGNHSKLARQAASDSIVLLKNTNNALPISKPKKLAIFGYHAGSAVVGPNTEMAVYGTQDSVYQGHMAQVGGSGQGSFSYLVTPEYALTTRAMADGTMLRAMLNDSVMESSGTGLTTVTGSIFSDSTAGRHTTTVFAYNQDACIVFMNSYSGEGGDRTELYNDDQD